MSFARQAANSHILLIDTDSQGHAALVTKGSKEYGTHDSLYSLRDLLYLIKTYTSD